MKKIFTALLIMLYSTSNSFSQNDSLTKLDEKIKLSKNDFDEYTKANQVSIVKVILDTLDSDSLVQHFYHNGNLFYQVTFKEGQENGWMEQYHPNGQFREKRFFLNGRTRYDSCSHVSFDRYGDTAYTSICITYHKKQYSCQTTYVFGERVSLMIYSNGLVAEFVWHGNKWEESDYHGKSAPYAKKLLKIYQNTILSK
jgi:antitoxin component YwqK of YwqJK toxin-antitoxin module